MTVSQHSALRQGPSVTLSTVACYHCPKKTISASLALHDTLAVVKQQSFMSGSFHAAVAAASYCSWSFTAPHMHTGFGSRLVSTSDRTSLLLLTWRIRYGGRANGVLFDRQTLETAATVSRPRISSVTCPAEAQSVPDYLGGQVEASRRISTSMRSSSIITLFCRKLPVSVFSALLSRFATSQ